MATKRQKYLHLGIFFWVSSIIIVLIPNWPYLYYRLSPQSSDSLASTIASTITAQALEPSVTPKPSNPWTSASPTPSPTPTYSLPDQDPTLPDTNGLIISKIGVRGEIHEGTNWQEILKTGIWRVPDFSTPENPFKPTILAAHRWGYLSWSNSFRKLNSFFSLPQLGVGDTIEIDWNQRAFKYQVYATSQGTAITDYSANLILYTCQLWNSPVRFFVYAKLKS